MSFSFAFDQQTLSFQTVKVRARVRLGGSIITLKPSINVRVAPGCGYEEKIKIINPQIIDSGKAYLFYAELKTAFSLEEYQTLILKRKPVLLQITLFPDIALPVLTAVPIPSAPQAITDDVSIAIPEALIGAIVAEVELPEEEESTEFQLKARVQLPDIVQKKDELEKKYTSACHLSVSANGRLLHEKIAIPWKIARLGLSPAVQPEKDKPVRVATTISVTIGKTELTQLVNADLNRQRKLELYCSKKSLLVTVQKPDILEVKVMEVFEDERRVPAEDAEISLHMADETSTITKIEPLSGVQALKATISQVNPTPHKEAVLMVVGSVPNGRIEQKIPVLFESKFVLRCEPRGRDPYYLIRWDAGSWTCDPIALILVQEGLESEPFPISSVEVTDSNGWFEPGNYDVDHGSPGGEYRVNLRFMDDVFDKLRPPQTENPVFAVLDDPKPEDYQKKAPKVELATQVTFSVTPPGSADSLSVDMTLFVMPPVPSWNLKQEYPVRLSGQPGKWNTIQVTSAPLPSGWEQGMEVRFCFADAASADNMGLSLKVQHELSPPQSDGIRLQIRGVMDIKSRIPCFKRSKKIPSGESPLLCPVRIITTGDYYGIVPDTGDVRMEPFSVSMYLDRYPAEDYPWDEPDHEIQVIRPDLVTNPTKWSILPVMLRYPKEWPEPPVRWEPEGTEDEGSPTGSTVLTSLDDRFENRSLVSTNYYSPSQEVWEKNGKPLSRNISCLVGEDEHETCIDESLPSEDRLYQTVRLDASLTLRKPLGKAKVLAAVRPKGFPETGQEMDFIDDSVFHTVSREFYIEVDLQKIPLKIREGN